MYTGPVKQLHRVLVQLMRTGWMRFLVDLVSSRKGVSSNVSLVVLALRLLSRLRLRLVSMIRLFFLGHDILELRPEGLDGGEVVTHLWTISARPDPLLCRREGKPVSLP